MLDLNSKSGLSDRVNFLVDAGIDSRVDEEPRRYLGCSAVGGECERAVQYEALTTVFRGISHVVPSGTAAIVFPPRTRRIFERGHLVEKCAAGWLRRAGFVLETLDPLTSDQREISFLGGRVLGHCDGILLHWLGVGTSPVQLPALWECKCLGHKWVSAMRRNGVRRSHPKYWAQMQLYMGGLRLQRGLITAVDADTMELRHELVEFDETAFKALLARAEHVLTCSEAGEMVPRCATTPAALECKMCHWAEACWKE